MSIQSLRCPFRHHDFNSCLTCDRVKPSICTPQWVKLSLGTWEYPGFNQAMHTSTTHWAQPRVKLAEVERKKRKLLFRSFFSKSVEIRNQKVKFGR